MFATHQFVRVALALAVCAFGAGAAVAQSYPSKPIRFVLPFPPGGGTDILGRILAQKLSEEVGQPVVPENRPGAGGNVGTEYASRQPPDGYTIVICAPSIAISPSLYSKLNYKQSDLTPIMRIASIPNAFVVHPVVPAKSVKELIALARKNPGKLNFGTGGAGTSNDLAARYFLSENKLDALIVPHKGVNQATIALLGGQVDMVVVGVATSAPHVKAGKLRALATLTTERTDTFPDVPTIVEAGLPWFTVDTWYVLMAPAGTPPEIINRLNAEFTKIVKSPDTRKQLAGRGAEPVTSTPEEADRFIKSETERWGKVVRQAGAKAN
ncbi:MAG: tripartite tricarboxylate transporter substrate binding protein [Betaproteobacteria bacterium]|nr:tripartite tricarboxylate transporter substrate binding protein [Betaproteobacteria bacterium]